MSWTNVSCVVHAALLLKAVGNACIPIQGATQDCTYLTRREDMHPVNEWQKWTIEQLQNAHHKAKASGLTSASVSYNTHMHHPRKSYKQAWVCQYQVLNMHIS